MHFAARKTHPRRRKTDIQSWEATVEQLARELCPQKEWEAFERQMLILKITLDTQNRKKVVMFPVWKKYRDKARKTAKLQNALPFMRYLPLHASSFLGELFLKP